MRRLLIISLIVVTVPLYAWDLYLLVSGFMAGGTDTAAAPEAVPSQALALASLPVARYEKKGRSPFLAYAEEPKPVVKAPAQATAPKKTVAPPEAPRITVTGIMWNPDNPLAMVTLPDGSSGVARKGEVLAGGIEVRKVEKNAIVVRSGGREFRIER